MKNNIYEGSIESASGSASGSVRNEMAMALLTMVQYIHPSGEWFKIPFVSKKERAVVSGFLQQSLSLLYVLHQPPLHSQRSCRS